MACVRNTRSCVLLTVRRYDLQNPLDDAAAVDALNPKASFVACTKLLLALWYEARLLGLEVSPHRQPLFLFSVI